MPANTQPIFLLTPKNAWATTGTSANTAFDGTGTVTTILTAGANGSRVTRVRLWHLGTNIATVVRLFLNNGSANSTPANNSLIQEVTMAANTASQTAASVPVDLALDIPMAAGYKINCTIGTAIASGIMVSIDYGDY